MELGLKRVIHAPKDTIGLMSIDSVFDVFTLEDKASYPKIPGETRIPAGYYKVGLRYSPKFTPRFGHHMLWIMDVPEFEYILFHPGNFNRDTAGCILVGWGVHAHVDSFSLEDSRVAYFSFYNKVAPLVNSSSVHIKVED